RDHAAADHGEPRRTGPSQQRAGTRVTSHVAILLASQPARRVSAKSRRGVSTQARRRGGGGAGSRRPGHRHGGGGGGSDSSSATAAAGGGSATRPSGRIERTGGSAPTWPVISRAPRLKVSHD